MSYGIWDIVISAAIGFVLGGNIGIIICAMCVASGRSEVDARNEE